MVATEAEVMIDVEMSLVDFEGPKRSAGMMLAWLLDLLRLPAYIIDERPEPNVRPSYD